MTGSLSPEQWLQRLGLDRIPLATPAGLFDLVGAYRRAIPFENLDVLAGLPMATGLEAIAEKIVANGRGGWCYELNTLFAEILGQTGFEVAYRLSRVAYRRPHPGPLTHLVLFVEMAGGPWLVDVGFGGPGPTGPLLLKEGETRLEDGARFRIDFARSGEIRLYRWIEADWASLYEIAPLAVQPIDLEMASHFLSTWEQSPFRKHFMCVAHDGEGNWTLEDGALVRRDACWASSIRTPLRDAAHLHATLESTFRLRVPQGLARAAWRRARGEAD